MAKMTITIPLYEKITKKAESKITPPEFSVAADLAIPPDSTPQAAARSQSQLSALKAHPDHPP